jgi:hypothetical protein
MKIAGLGDVFSVCQTCESPRRLSQCGPEMASGAGCLENITVCYDKCLNKFGN